MQTIEIRTQIVNPQIQQEETRKPTDDEIYELARKRRRAEARAKLIFDSFKDFKSITELSNMSEITVLTDEMSKTNFLSSLHIIVKSAMLEKMKNKKSTYVNEDTSHLWTGACIAKAVLVVKHIDKLVSEFFTDYEERKTFYRFIPLFVVGYILRMGKACKVRMMAGTNEEELTDTTKVTIALYASQSVGNGSYQTLQIDTNLMFSTFNKVEQMNKHTRRPLGKVFMLPNFRDQYRVTKFFLDVMSNRIDLSRLESKTAEAILKTIPEGKVTSSLNIPYTANSNQKVQWMMNNHK